MNIPVDLKYTKDHEWIRVEGDEAVIGVTDFAQSELGDIVFVEIETEGEELDQEEVFGTVEAVKTVSDLFMPISGEVLAFNEELEDTPEKVNDVLPFGINPPCVMSLYCLALNSAATLAVADPEETTNSLVVKYL